MPDERTFGEKQRILLDVVNRMKQHTAPSLTQICGNFDDTTGELIGTGTFLSLPDGLYVLTAQHVASELYTEKPDGTRKYASGLSHSVGNNRRIMRIAGQWITWGTPQDIAVTQVDPIDVEGSGLSPLLVDQFALNTRSLDDDLYFIHGWPGKQSYFTTFYERGVLSKSRPYGGWLESSCWSGFDESIHFAISYPPDQLIDENGSPTDFVDPGGMSGAVVWKTNKVGVGDEWTPDMARVVGLAHRFDQDARSIVVTRIEYVKGLLLHILRSNYAYFRWLERGKPLWDDLDDWIAAEKVIHNLCGSKFRT